MQTIRHNDSGKLVVIAKLLTGYVTVKSKIEDVDSFIKLHQTFDADFVAYIIAWQGNHGLTPDGVIGPKTWAAIAGAAPTCSTSKHKTSGYTLALQILMDSSITADGIYGRRTKNAVAAYQSCKGLACDGICGPKTWTALIIGTVEGVKTHAVAVAEGTFVQPTDFKQYDKRWADKMYSNHGDREQTMRTSACGPTSMADIVHFVVDNTITPYTLALMALEWKDRTYNSGTSWKFFTHIQAKYGWKKMVATKSIETLKACLDAGGYVVCCMGKGYWTSGGHFICAWKYSNKYIYCNDPASGKRTHQNVTDFVKQRKQFFCFFPNAA